MFSKKLVKLVEFTFFLIPNFVVEKMKNIIKKKKWLRKKSRKSIWFSFLAKGDFIM
jgi:hypothetical protein